MTIYIIALIASALGMGFFVYLRRSGKKEGIKEVKLETAEKVIANVQKAHEVDIYVDGLSNADVDRELQEWRRK